MGLLNRADVVVPQLPQEQVPFPLLGGDVIVRGLRLTERLRLREAMRGAEPLAFIPALLALAVVGGDGQPIASAQEWEDMGASAPADTGALYAKAYDLSGFDMEKERKN